MFLPNFATTVLAFGSSLWPEANRVLASPSPAGGSSDVVAIIGAAAAGGFAAIFGQYLANRAARSSQQSELRYREKELWTSLIMPASEARVRAIQDIYNVIQRVIEGQALSIEMYLVVQKQLIYLPEAIAPRLLSALTLALDSNREGATVMASLKQCQGELRHALGLRRLDELIEGEGIVSE